MCAYVISKCLLDHVIVKVADMIILVDLSVKVGE